MKNEFYIGTAAWTLPKAYRDEFGEADSQLERYATRLKAVEINTSFYRDHKRETYVRWAEAVPEDFRFSVKLSKVFTHEQKLKRGEKALAPNLADISALGQKLGVLLVQLPPKLAFDPMSASAFFREVRECYRGPLAFEPRHISWDSPEARDLAAEVGLSRVISDPQPYFSRRLSTMDFDQIVYVRLHGSPEIYRSNYDAERLHAYAAQMSDFARQVPSIWCIFDNTTFGYATGNALELDALLKEGGDFVRDKFASGLGQVQPIGQQPFN